LNYFNYFSEIEETFNRRRGKYLFLSPLDWALIESWQERGVPLHVVLRGIEKVFDGVDGAATKRKRSVKSLTYCREEIEAQYEEWLERQIGKNGDSSAEASENDLFAADALKAHLENAAAELTAAAEKATGELREALARAAARLAELKNSYADAESLEAALEDLEKMIDAALLESATPTEIESHKTEIGKQMAHYRGKMESDVFNRTFDLMLLKKLRERAGIPRISLFYL
jgi:chromosome segregation ATPase